MTGTDRARLQAFASRHVRPLVTGAAIAVLAVGALLLIPMPILIRGLAANAAIAWWCFVILYGTQAPWWRSALGRNYLGLGLLIASIVTLVALGLHGIVIPGRTGVRFVLYGSLLILGVRHAYDFVAGQVRGRHQRLEVIARHTSRKRGED